MLSRRDKNTGKLDSRITTEIQPDNSPTEYLGTGENFFQETRDFHSASAEERRMKKERVCVSQSDCRA